MSPSRRAALVAALATVATLAWPVAGHGYNEAIHVLLDERAVPAALASRAVAPPTLAVADALRAALWEVGRTHPDARVREVFLARWPAAAGFDRWALKELLGLTPEHELFGIDRMPERVLETAGALLAAGARQPDDDRRNRERFAHDAARAIRKDRYGRPLPLDPKQLDLGARTGTSSQAWAHYGLPAVDFSDEVDVLKATPWRWSYAPAPRAFAADFAALHTDLALCAASLDDPAGEGLAWLLAGQAHHYVEDVANQVHTLQAIYPFFFDAKIESIKEELRSGGGLLRSRPSFVDIGLQIITNHHLVGEDLFASRIADLVAGRGPAEPHAAEALAAITAGDTVLEQDLDRLGLLLGLGTSGPAADGLFARAITQAVIERSALEGGALYEATRAVVSPELSRAGVAYADGDDPGRWARGDVPRAAWDRFYALQTAGFARAGTALRRHVALLDATLAPGRRDPARRRALLELVGRRLIAQQLAVLAEAEARLAAWEPPPPATETITWWVPALGAGLVILILLVVWAVVRRRRRRRAAGNAPA